MEDNLSEFLKFTSWRDGEIPLGEICTDAVLADKQEEGNFSPEKENIPRIISRVEFRREGTRIIHFK